MNANGRMQIAQGAQGGLVTVRCEYMGEAREKTVSVTYDNQLAIECAPTIVGTSGNAVATYNSEPVSASWSVAAGGGHASIAQDGSVTVASDGDVTIRAEYGGYVTQRTVSVRYEPGTTSQTTVGEDGSVTTERQTVVENPDGSTETTT